jgi:hypothetical protein
VGLYARPGDGTRSAIVFGMSTMVDICRQPIAGKHVVPADQLDDLLALPDGRDPERDPLDCRRC